MIRKLLTFLLIINLITLIMTPTISYAMPSHMADNLNNNSVTIVEAEKAAIYYVNKYSAELTEWRDAKIDFPVTYYSVDKLPIAYEFTVLKGNEKTGFIIISGKKDWMPVLEWGNGNAPSSYLPDVYTVAEKENLVVGREMIEPVFFYFGALSYSVQISQKMKDNGILIHLPTGTLLQMPKEQPSLQMDSESARAEWTQIIEYTESDKLILSTRVIIPGVPAWYQSYGWNIWCDEGDATTSYPACVGPANDYWHNWDGCAPIAGAMAIGYWDNHGYPNLPTSDDDELIDQNHYWMATDYWGGTNSGMIPSGIWLTSTCYGYNFSCTYVVSPLWTDVTTLVNQNKPFLFNVQYWPGSNPPAGHCVCGVGYYISSQNFLVIHNTWEGSDQNLAWGSWGGFAILCTPIPG